MVVLKYDETPFEQVNPGLRRHVIHTKNLMSVLIEFMDGPWKTPQPFH
jgi:hypothetical protein